MRLGLTLRSRRLGNRTVNQSAVSAVPGWSFGWWYYAQPEEATALA